MKQFKVGDRVIAVERYMKDEIIGKRGIITHSYGGTSTVRFDDPKLGWKDGHWNCPNEVLEPEATYIFNKLIDDYYGT